jgi:hypothetical protein
MKVLELGPDGVLPIIDFKGKIVALFMGDCFYKLTQRFNGYGFKDPFHDDMYHIEKTPQECCQNRLETVGDFWRTSHPTIVFDSKEEYQNYCRIHRINNI